MWMSRKMKCKLEVHRPIAAPGNCERHKAGVNSGQVWMDAAFYINFQGGERERNFE